MHYGINFEQPLCWAIYLKCHVSRHNSLRYDHLQNCSIFPPGEASGHWTIQFHKNWRSLVYWRGSSYLQSRFSQLWHCLLRIDEQFSFPSSSQAYQWSNLSGARHQEAFSHWTRHQQLQHPVLQQNKERWGWKANMGDGWFSNREDKTVEIQDQLSLISSWFLDWGRAWNVLQEWVIDMEPILMIWSNSLTSLTFLPLAKVNSLFSASKLVITPCRWITSWWNVFA